MAEDVGEAGAVEEEEGARDDNFSPHNCYRIVGDFGFFFCTGLVYGIHF